MLVLNKVLPLFVLPLGLSVILLVWGHARKRRVAVWLAVLLLILSSNPLVGRLAIRSAEGWADRRVPADVPSVDAIVVLSAGRLIAPGPARVSEWGEANRFFGGLELFQANKARWIVFTAAWNGATPPTETEGEILRDLAIAMGVPRDRVLLTAKVANTVDEAREARQTLAGAGVESPRVLLVTSAFHMPRATQTFSRAGFVVEPYPVDFWVSEARGFAVMDVLPNASALLQTQTAVREFYGRAFYGLRDWLRAR